MNAQQLETILRHIVAASGPITAAVTLLFGQQASETMMIILAAITALTPTIALVWSLLVKTDKGLVTVAAQVPGVQILVAPSAPPGVQAAADDDSEALRNVVHTKRKIT